MHVEPHDTPEALESAARAERTGRVRDRIRAVILARRGRTAKEIAGDLGVCRRVVQDWVRWYNEGGLPNLPDGPRSGAPRKCPREKFETVRARILEGPRPEDGVCTLRGRDVQRILHREFGVAQQLSATYDLMHRLGLTPLRPRPRHAKNDPAVMKAWEERAPLLSSRSGRRTPTSGSRSGSRTRPGSVSRAP
jgi:transposase